MTFPITKIKVVFLVFLMISMHNGVKSQGTLFSSVNRSNCPKCPHIPILHLEEAVVVSFVPDEESNLMADCYELSDDSGNTHAIITFDFLLNKQNQSLMNLQPHSFALKIKALDINNNTLTIDSIHNVLFPNSPANNPCNQSTQWEDLIDYIPSDTAWRGRFQVLVDLSSNPYGGYIKVEFELGYKTNCQSQYVSFSSPSIVMSGLPCQQLNTHNVARQQAPIEGEMAQRAIISPNPTRKRFSILFDFEPARQVEVQLFDLHGRMVHNVMREAFFLNNSYQLLIDEQFKPGIYFLKINSGNFQQSSKLIIAE